MKAKVNTKLRKADTVVVISGKYKGKRGKIIDIDFASNRALVERVNLVKKTMKKTQENPKGGIIEKEIPIDLSNLMYWDNSTNKRVRLGYQYASNGKKERYLKNAQRKVIS